MEREVNFEAVERLVEMDLAGVGPYKLRACEIARNFGAGGAAPRESLLEDYAKIIFYQTFFLGVIDDKEAEYFRKEFLCDLIGYYGMNPRQVADEVKPLIERLAP